MYYYTFCRLCTKDIKAMTTKLNVSMTISSTTKWFEFNIGTIGTLLSVFGNLPLLREWVVLCIFTLSKREVIAHKSEYCGKQ